MAAKTEAIPDRAVIRDRDLIRSLVEEQHRRELNTLSGTAAALVRERLTQLELTRRELERASAGGTNGGLIEHGGYSACYGAPSGGRGGDRHSESPPCDLEPTLGHEADRRTPRKKGGDAA